MIVVFKSVLWPRLAQLRQTDTHGTRMSTPKEQALEKYVLSKEKELCELKDP